VAAGTIRCMHHTACAAMQAQRCSLASAGFRPLRSERMVRFAQDQQRRQPIRCIALTNCTTTVAHTNSCAAYRSLSRPIVALRMCRQSTVPTVIACAAVLSGTVPTVNRVPHESAKPVIA
jgi:hypothetical protein